MITKGMQEWVDFITNQLNLICEKTPWGNRFKLPPESGIGYMESFENPGLWVVWRCDIVLQKELITSYMQDTPYYIGFAYRDTRYPGKIQEIAWPSDEIVDFKSTRGMSMRGIGAFFFTSFFEQLDDNDVMDFISSVQSYDDNGLMKQITPILQQMRDHPGDGLALRLFLESRMLEIASILIKLSECERRNEKLSLSAYDVNQLYKVTEILEERLAQPPRIIELARMVAFNEFKLKMGFKQQFGTTIFEYLRLLRMEKAINLLKDPQLSPGNVGQQVGYKTYHGFNNAFRKYYGVTPLEWQKHYYY